PETATNVLRERFLTKCGIDTYRIEGFEGSLFEFYNRELLKNDVYILRGKKAAPEVNKAAYEVIRSAFVEEEAGSPEAQDPLYAALAFLCAREGIDILSSSQAAAVMGRSLTVPGIAEASHFLCRKIVLPENWYKKDIGPVMGTFEGEPVACFRGAGGAGYYYLPSAKTVRRLTPEIAARIHPEAYSIKRGLPWKSLTLSDVLAFCRRSIGGWDFAALLLCEFLCVVIGLLLPTLNQLVYDRFIPYGRISESGEQELIRVSLMIGSCMLCSLLLSVMKNLAGYRITSRVGFDLQDAVYDRVFRLPETFFRQYGSADLGKRIMWVSETARQISSTCVVTVTATVFSFVYVFRMGKYAQGQGGLAPTAVLLYFGYAAVVCVFSLLSVKYEKRIYENDGEARSRLFQYLNSIDKIRLTGVEDRAAYSYLQPFSAVQAAELRRNRLFSASEALASVASSVFSLVFYMVILKNSGNIAVGNFVAFTSAFGIFTASFQQLLTEGMGLFRLRDRIRMFAPVFTCSPEDDSTREEPGKITGQISVEHVSFSYQAGGKDVLKDVSFDIRPGEYVGIVGASGCGKSTLLKLLLGFETPSVGMILYDGKDLKRLNKSSLRKKMGVVLQNGRLVSGSIYENITITSPGATMEEVEDVIAKVGLKEEIDQMPMGIHTVLNETSNTISGGQQQRILIARAIINKPSLLIFDEATSALDNITQAVVCENLDRMNVTRIVVAHRLSTIRNCDRILVLENGEIAEEGSYDSLMEKKGIFCRLASRQITS
ncbi:MAG: ATP-binding cassette domain-containing protein, partial [Clostridiales bacterium]|nr:ATP-binding cassette domain-containing protein [Clostridiales bacterium]